MPIRPSADFPVRKAGLKASSTCTAANCACEGEFAGRETVLNNVASEAMAHCLAWKPDLLPSNCFISVRGIRRRRFCVYDSYLCCRKPGGIFMTAAKVVILLLQASIFLTVFSLGLDATFQDASWLLQRPRRLLRSLVAMNVIMPLFAALLAAAFHLHPAVKAALVLLAVSPVPPMLPRQQLKLAGTWSYVLGLLVTTSLLAIVLVPLTIKLLAAVFNVEMGIRPASVAKVVVTTVLLPLMLGIVVHVQAPGLAERRGPVLARVAFAILVLIAVSLLVVEWRSMVGLVGNGTLASIVAFIFVGVTAGHLLGGPDPANRTTLALATASRHPGLAMAIASANFPGQFRLIAAAIVLYLLVKAVVLIPYNAWSKRRHARKPEAPHGRQAA